MSQPTSSARWAAPDLAAFERMADAAFAELPEAFRALCGDIVIRIADFPEEDALRSLGLESEYDLLGLFQGIGLAQASATQPAVMPNMIWLYRRPILDYWAENEDTLGAIITHVLVHEIGHHFGLSDADMEEIEARP
jgi:predicted Zn-dependent protease with MMP-like domain